MDEIRESSEGSNETIAKLRSQMLLVEEQMKQCGTSSYVCDQEISGYKLNSSNQEVRAEEKVNEVGLLERETNELRKEEWMTFINEEFQTA